MGAAVLFFLGLALGFGSGCCACAGLVMSGWLRGKGLVEGSWPPAGVEVICGEAEGLGIWGMEPGIIGKLEGCWGNGEWEGLAC